ncbi:hypothetical protein RMQ97_01185 [Maricaulis sp. D1M11]|uniref:hypothetical protein n=1 Tax=Maricaulis sp. D1M11 TaxID=3076117 RepID=UPI0039B695B9
MTLSHLIPTLLFSTVFTATALAHPVRSPADDTLTPAFDILDAHATTDGRLVTFMMELNGMAGSVKPEAVGQLTGSQVDAYVWPTSLDPATVGFDAGSGRLALAITAHPDFDDTPLFDENNDGDPANDGADWHSHWVVLVPEDACGAGLKVRDVSPGQDLLPATAPGLPIALDSPGMSPVLQGRTARITVPVSEAEHQSFDAVTARLEVHPDGAQPLLCVTGVYDIGSGDLSLPGVIMGETE